MEKFDGYTYALQLPFNSHSPYVRTYKTQRWMTAQKKKKKKTARKKERQTRLVFVVRGIKHHCSDFETLPYFVAAETGVLERGMETDCGGIQSVVKTRMVAMVRVGRGEEGKRRDGEKGGGGGGGWFLLLTSSSDPLLRVVDLQHRHLIRLLVRKVIPPMLRVEPRVEVLPHESPPDQIVEDEVVRLDGAAVADRQRPALDGFQGFPDTSRRKEKRVLLG